MKIAILGHNGMAGHVIMEYLRKKHKILILEREDFNIIPSKLRTVNGLLMQLKEKQIDVIINAIGVLKKESEERPDTAALVNAWFPHYLADMFVGFDTRIIHISTDCVFNGETGAYQVTNSPNANDTYGLTKALGEIIDDKNLTIRTSIIGPELKKGDKGQGLLHWFMQQQGTINGYCNAWWNGVTTLELAKFIELAIEKNIRGLYQLTSAQFLCKYDLLQIINSRYNAKLKINRTYGIQIDRTLVPNTHDFYTPRHIGILIDEMKTWYEKI